MIDRISPNSVHGSDKKTASEDMENGGKLPFLFEVQDKDNNTLYEFVLPLSPENYDFQFQPMANNTLTQGGSFQDVIGVAPAKINMSGTFGFAGTTVIGASAKSIRGSEGGKGFSALDMYLEMETMLLDFYALYGAIKDSSELKGKSIAKDLAASKYAQYIGQTGNIGRILFFNFTDRHYYEIQLDNFKLQRNLQRRHLYQYTIQMTGLQSIDSATAARLKKTAKDAGKQLALADAASAASKIGKFAAFMKNAYGAAYTVVSEAEKLKAQMDEISTGVTMFKNGLTTLVHTPFDVIQSAKATADSVMASIVSIANLPHEIINDVRETQRLLFGYEDRQDLFVSPIVGAASTPTIPRGSDVIKNEIVSVPVTPAMIAAGYTSPDIPEENLFTSADAVALIASKQQAITDSDTIYTVAQKNGVDWKQIAIINNLEAPYQLTAGNTILIPSLDNGQTAVTAKTLSDFEQRTFFADERLDDNGFLVAENGSVGIVQGTANLSMQLKHRLSTGRGELAELGYVDYGSNMPQYIGKPNLDMWLRRALLEFKSTVLEDSRVDTVSNIKTDVVNDRVYLIGDVYPIGQTASIDVVQPFS